MFSFVNKKKHMIKDVLDVKQETKTNLLLFPAYNEYLLPDSSGHSSPDCVTNFHIITLSEVDVIHTTFFRID